MKAYIFPGQGVQHPGMGKDLYTYSSKAKKMFTQADELLGFSISQIMFEGSQAALRETKVTQPAIFLYSVILANITPDFKPDMVAGHSLGEISALVANQVLSFEDGLKLTVARSKAMQQACEEQPSGMAAIVGLSVDKVEEVCKNIEDVVPANYNTPQQIVISGTLQGLDLACAKLLKLGAKRAIPLQVGGAFHSPLMISAQKKFAEALTNIQFRKGICPIYQNTTASPSEDPIVIQQNLILQLTSPVRWTQIVERMITDGITHFIECGPGKVLIGLTKKINHTVDISSCTIDEEIK